MKPFDIELAKANHPVQTRDGRPARIICYDAKNPTYSIVALVTKSNREVPESYCTDGIYNGDGTYSNLDLVMAPTKKEGWINIYTGVNGNIVSGSVFKREADAINNKIETFDYVATIKIEWEE